MNILHLSTYDYGGAGKAAYRLHENFISAGYNSKMAVRFKNTKDPNVIKLNSSSNINKITHIFKKIAVKLFTEQRYYFQLNGGLTCSDIYKFYLNINFKPDIIIAHWISNYLSIENLHQISNISNAPIIWYLMDMAPLTGGCHYAWECDNYCRQCGNCPALHSNNAIDISYKNWFNKSIFINKMNISIVSASSWAYQQSQNSALFKNANKRNILIGIDSEIFKPINREVARKKLKLPLNSKIIYFGAQSLKIKRKGLLYLINALTILFEENNEHKRDILIVSSGEKFDHNKLLTKTFKHMHLGFLNNDKILATAYQSADLFVCPSIEDSGPMMINEAIMCGTPVVSFEMGSALDFVHNGKTGYRAILKDSNDLSKGIRFILNLNDSDAAKMSKECREIGMKLCASNIQRESFIDLFKTLTQDMKNEG